MKKIFSFLTALFFTGSMLATTASLTISSKPASSSETLVDNQSNNWAFTSDGNISGNETNLIHVGTNSSSVSYIQLLSSGLSSANISNITVYGAAKANTSTTIKVYIGEELLGTSSQLTNTSTSGGTEFSVNNTNNYSGEIKILISRPDKVNGAIYFNSASVTYATGGTPTPLLSVEPTIIDFGTVEQNAVVEDTSITVIFSDLTGAVTYSGLSSPFSASGIISNTGDEITISANTATVGDYSQTLTIQSVDDSKSVDVTVKMNVIEPFDGQRLIFDLSENNLSLPTAKGSSVAGKYFYILNGVEYTFYATDVQGSADGGIYFGGTYTMIYPGNALGLPAINNYKLVKVEATNSSTCSTSTEVSISSSDTTKTDVTGGEMQIWSTKGIMYTYDLSETVINTMYYLWVANKNCQIVELILYYKEVSPPTGLENIFENKAIKVIEDNKIVIKRNNIKYNILGQSL